ncbi:MAG: hypothetical protein ACLTBV_18330 [Enterocloster bolteae]
MKAFEEDRMLLDVLLEDCRVTSKINRETLEELLEPANYAGSCAACLWTVPWNDGEMWGNL